MSHFRTLHKGCVLGQYALQPSALIEKSVGTTINFAKMDVAGLQSNNAVFSTATRRPHTVCSLSNVPDVHRVRELKKPRKYLVELHTGLRVASLPLLFSHYIIVKLIYIKMTLSTPCSKLLLSWPPSSAMLLTFTSLAAELFKIQVSDFMHCDRPRCDG